MADSVQRQDGWDENAPEDPRGLDETPDWLAAPYRQNEREKTVYVAEPHEISHQDIVALGRLGADGWNVVILPADTGDRVRIRIYRREDVVFRRPGRPN